MADEFIHKDVGAVLLQDEYHNILAHKFNNQAIGDTLYASSALQLLRRGIGSTNAVYQVVGGVPDWVTNPTIASPTFSETVTLSSLTASELVATNASKGLVSLAVATYPSLTELSYVKGLSSAVQTQLGLKAPLVSPTFTGTVTMETGNHQLYWSHNANIAIGLNNAGSSNRTLFDWGVVATDTLRIGGDNDPVRIGTGFALSASQKLQAASGVVGFSVVSTALTLGSLGSVIIPQSAANATDALAGNIAGAIALDLTGSSERFYFRGASWFYISKTGGLSMTKEERVDPTGHLFEVGDTVKLIVDKVNPDGSFHALPYHSLN